MSNSERGYSSLKKGKDFEALVAKSFCLVKSFVLRLHEGQGQEMPADFVFCLTNADYMIECKSTVSRVFAASLVKKHQITGLLSFEALGARRHKGFIVIEFSTIERYVAIRIKNYVNLIKMTKKLSHSFEELKANGHELVKVNGLLDIMEFVR